MVIPSSLAFDTYEHFSIPRSLLHQTRKNAQRNAKRLLMNEWDEGGMVAPFCESVPWPFSFLYHVNSELE